MPQSVRESRICNNRKNFNDMRDQKISRLLTKRVGSNISSRSKSTYSITQDAFTVGELLKILVIIGVISTAAHLYNLRLTPASSPAKDSAETTSKTAEVK